MKRLNLNWGSGIAVSYLGFVAMIFALVAMSVREKIDLVTSQYYVEELKFQDKIDKVKAAAALPDPLTWEVTDKAVNIHYPQSQVNPKLAGSIRFYCPANDKNDRTFKVQAINGGQILPLAKVPAGRYRLQIDWTNGPQGYWNEGVVVISH